MIDAATLPKIDPADYLLSEEDIPVFLEDQLADNDSSISCVALESVQPARKRLGLPRVGLEKGKNEL